MLKLEPLGDRVVVIPDNVKEKSEGGVFIPDSAKEIPEEGTVVAVGRGRVLDNGDLMPVQLKIGDRVVFSRYAGSDIRLGSKRFLLFGERDILIRTHGDVLTECPLCENSVPAHEGKELCL
jgi:chaperonin GroES